MRRRVFIILVCSVMLNAGKAWAQPAAVDRWTPPAPSAGVRLAADGISYGTVGLAMALDAKAAWDAPERAHALSLFGVRAMTTFVSTQLAKGIAKRNRPCAPSCGVDKSDTSFFSAHTTFAFSTLGGPRLSIVLPLGGATAAGRVVAGKHWLTDTLAGAIAGSLISRIR